MDPLLKRFIDRVKNDRYRVTDSSLWIFDGTYVNEENNIYIQLGFKFDGYTPPDYKYYNPTIDRYRRFHKFGFRKKILLKKYPNI